MILEASRFRFLFLPLFLAIACEPSLPSDEGNQEGWQGTSEQVGDTLVVRSVAGSVWRGVGNLVEEVAIGTETRGENDLLGQIMSLDAAGDRIYMADMVFCTVRVYDMDGNHLMNIGRDGGGPGEFRSVTALGIDPVRGELVVRESSGILNRFTLDGRFLSRSRKVGQGSRSGEVLLLRVTRKGAPMVSQMYVLRNPQANQPLRTADAFFTLDSTGVFSDTLVVPRMMGTDDPLTMRAYVTGPNGRERSFKPVPVPFGPQETWTISMDGEYVGGRPSDFRFEIRHGDGRVTVMEREAEVIVVDPEEKRAAERRVYGILQGFNPGWAWDGPSIPDTKPFYSAIIPDRSQRVWVLREGKGHPVEGWTEPDDWRGWENYPAWVPERWFEVFEIESGRYLGRVDVPADFQVEPEPFILGDTVIALTEDETGRPIVRRYRLQFPLETATEKRVPAQ